MMKTKEATVTYTFDEDIVSDLHKDAFGFRPSEGFWVNWNCASDDAKQTVWDGLIYALNRAMDEQKAAYDAAKSEYEARLAEYISIGAKDRATAIRWLVQSLELTEDDKWYGAEYICYTLGLPNSMQSEFKGVV
jgi:hypothetical protein